MSLAAGTRLGPYEIIAAIGAGGMGEVYRATDSNLKRSVAIKVLPASVAGDADRLARFQREAEVLAALNHPNIAAIYGLEKTSDLTALVMELVAGEDLSAHIARGAIPLAEALPIAKQIADALEAAHEQGIVHRDLKPANIKVRDDGTVKILDFGLARWSPGASDPGSKDPGLPANSVNSPTITAVFGTEMGMVLGTAAYMSPEQARGRAIDKRTDVWAFGCVLYEMLSGKRAFDGEDATEMISSVMKGEPDWSALPAALPVQVRTIVMRCLTKDRKARIPDLSVVRFALDESLTTAAPAASGHAARGSALAWKVAAGVLAVTTIAAAAAAVTWYVARGTAPQVARFTVAAPDNATFVIQGGKLASVGAISPDGKTIAFTARDAADKQLLWLRRIDAVTAQVVPGSDGATFPFWSPDSRHVGFSIGLSTGVNKLVKVEVSGGPIQPLCPLFPGITARGATWNGNGVIVFNNGPRALYRVSDQGGDPQPVGTLQPGEGGQDFPSFLPDGQHFLYDAGGAGKAGKNVSVGSLDGGPPKEVLSADTGAIYVPATGSLLFVRRGTLLAQSFDLATFSVRGEPVPIAENVESSTVAGLVAFSASDTGILTYGIGDMATWQSELVWVDRAGKVLGKAGSPADYRGIDLSPDERLIVSHHHDDALLLRSGDVWLTEVAGGRTWRLTTDASQDNGSPVFSSDGKRVAFASTRNGKNGIYVKSLESIDDADLLIEFEGNAFMGPVPESWTPDGLSILFGMQDEVTQKDLWLLPLSTRKPVAFARTRFTERHARVSPNGRWVAFMSGETGRGEIYVQPISPSGPKQLVSAAGGQVPRWRDDSRELFYVSQSTMMSVDVTATGSTFHAGTPVALFGAVMPVPPHVVDYFPYAVTKDGQRFLLTRRQSDAPSDVANPIVVVLNWTAVLGSKR